MGKNTAVHTLQAASGLCIYADNELFSLPKFAGTDPAGAPNRSLAESTLHCILRFVLCFQPRGSFLVMELVQ